jgi:hypothetical protein
MKVKLTTAILLIVCGLGIGWAAYQNIMWAVWGKQNSWYEYVGFGGCPIMLVAGFTALKSLRVGSYLGLLGYFLMLFYLAPALLNTFRGIAKTGRVLEPIRIVFLALIVALPLLALGRLFLNVLRIRARARITKPCS